MVHTKRILKDEGLLHFRYSKTPDPLVFMCQSISQKNISTLSKQKWKAYNENIYFRLD